MHRSRTTWFCSVTYWNEAPRALQAPKQHWIADSHPKVAPGVRWKPYCGVQNYTRIQLIYLYTIYIYINPICSKSFIPPSSSHISISIITSPHILPFLSRVLLPQNEPEEFGWNHALAGTEWASACHSHLDLVSRMQVAPRKVVQPQSRQCLRWLVAHSLTFAEDDWSLLEDV